MLTCSPVNRNDSFISENLRGFDTCDMPGQQPGGQTSDNQAEHNGRHSQTWRNMDGQPEYLEDRSRRAGQKMGGGTHFPGNRDIDRDQTEHRDDKKSSQQSDNRRDQALADGFGRDLHDHLPVRPADRLEDTDLTASFGDISGHGLESDQNGDDDDNQGNRQGELVRQGKEASERLEKDSGVLMLAFGPSSAPRLETSCAVLA